MKGLVHFGAKSLVVTLIRICLLVVSVFFFYLLTRRPSQRKLGVFLRVNVFPAGIKAASLALS